MTELQGAEGHWESSLGVDSDLRRDHLLRQQLSKENAARVGGREQGRYKEIYQHSVHTSHI